MVHIFRRESEGSKHFPLKFNLSKTKGDWDNYGVASPERISYTLIVFTFSVCTAIAFRQLTTVEHVISTLLFCGEINIIYCRRLIFVSKINHCLKMKRGNDNFSHLSVKYIYKGIY